MTTLLTTPTHPLMQIPI